MLTVDCANAVTLASAAIATRVNTFACGSKLLKGVYKVHD
jgi:hypothetical protein